MRPVFCVPRDPRVAEPLLFPPRDCVPFSPEGCLMTQAELNREVAYATGESVDTIAQMGFVVLTRIPIEREPLHIDWDRLDADRRVSLHRPRVRACAA